MLKDNTKIYTILLVEDNPADADRMEDLLNEEKSANFKVKHVVRMKDAKIELKEDNYDLILLDIYLPDAVGLETVKQMKEDAQHIPIIVITGINEEKLAQQCIDEGAHDYLVKAHINDSAIKTIGYSLLRDKNSSINELERIIAQFRELSSYGSGTSVTASLSGTGAVKERYYEIFEELVNDYSDLLHLYLDQLVTKKEKPQFEMEKLATRLGDAGGGPRDLLDIHLAALDQLVLGKDSQRSQSFAVEGRLLALEMMGILVDYYRVGNRRRFL